MLICPFILLCTRRYAKTNHKTAHDLVECDRNNCMTLLERNKHNFWPERIVATLFLLALLVIMINGVINTQSDSRRALETRFAQRSTNASTFLDSYVQYTLDRQQELAKLRLNADEVSRDDFLDFLDNFGFGPSVLLDDSGRIINIAPYKEELIGRRLTEDSPHIRAAVVEGEQTVSNIVPSDALKFPNVAFATPFETQAGRRIISGAYDLTTKPLGNYFENIVPLKGSAAYLVDANNNVIATNKDQSGTLASLDQNLAKELVVKKSKDIKTQGFYKNANGKKLFYATHLVPNTPWKVVTTIEKDDLYSPESGSKQYLPWVFLIGFAIASTALVIMLIRNREKRIALQDISLIDLFTGIYNSQGVKLHLRRLLSAARRHNNDLTIFKVDIDNFKDFNENHGNSAGDEILIGVTNEIQSRLRTEDILGRCSGEEFVVILPDTDVNGASIVAERIRRGVEEDVRAIGDSEAKVTISIGITGVEKDDTPESISLRAEASLKEAKTSGKNKVSTSEETQEVSK